MVRLALLLGLVFGLGESVVAQDLPNVHRSNQGYSIRYPADWKVLDSQNMAQLQQQIQGVLGNSNGPDVMIYTGNVFDAAVNINVVVIPKELPINEEARTMLRGIPNQMATKMGGRASEPIVRDEMIHGCKAISTQYDLTIQDKKLTQLQIGLPKAGQTYIITCSAPFDEFRSYEPKFRMMAASLDSTSAFGGMNMPRWAITALIGGLIGGLIGLAKAMTNKQSGI